MKPLSIFDRFIFFLNASTAFLILAACAVPHISNEKFSFLSFLSLTVPILVSLNLVFLIYWLVKRKRQLWLSLFVALFGYFALGTFVKLNFSEEKILDEDLSVMSYNVRNFNKFEELESATVFEDVKSLIDKEQPDIICFQEPGYLRRNEYLEDYPYQYLDYVYLKGKVLVGIFSKYPIVARDMFCFPNSTNNGIYADILYKKDTIRVYNVHLQSLGITPGKGIIKNKPKKRLLKMLNENFKLQQQQAKIIAENMQSNSYYQILCGDFNNTQFSNVYKTIKRDKNDTFLEKGSGYGRTLIFHKIPVRIDFILADPAFEVKAHKNYDEEYSDHYAIMASFRLKLD